MIRKFLNWLMFWKREKPITLVSAVGQPLFINQPPSTQRSITTLQARCERLLYAKTRAANRGDVETAKRLMSEIEEKQALIEKLMEVPE